MWMHREIYEVPDAHVYGHAQWDTWRGYQSVCKAFTAILCSSFHPPFSFSLFFTCMCFPSPAHSCPSPSVLSFHTWHRYMSSLLHAHVSWPGSAQGGRGINTTISPTLMDINQAFLEEDMKSLWDVVRGLVHEWCIIVIFRVVQNRAWMIWPPALFLSWFFYGLNL